MASVRQIAEEKFPIKEMVEELKLLTDNPDLLGDFLKDEEIPIFILSYNHERSRIKVSEQFRNTCKIYFVCSTDDPYLDTFRKELSDWENLLVFSKEDYIGDITINGDDLGLVPPFNRVASIARRYVSDYVEKNNISHYIMSDNDLNISLRTYDGKRYPFSDEMLWNGIRTYFYLLDKYEDKLSWINAVSVLGEIGGAAYKDCYIRPACLGLYFCNRPINWRGRYFEDDITELLMLKEDKKIAITFPYIRFECLVKIGEGDMSEAYKKLADTHGVERTFKGLKPARLEYINYFFRDMDIPGKDNPRLFYGKILKYLLEHLV